MTTPPTEEKLDMVQITGGKIVYRRTIQPAPYESIGAEVEFAFLVDDGEKPEDAAADVLDIARAEVNEAIKLKRAKAADKP